MRVLIIFALISWITNRLENSKKETKKVFNMEDAKEKFEEKKETTNLSDLRLDDLREIFMEKKEVVEEVIEAEPLITSEHSMEHKSEERPKRERMARVKFQDSTDSTYKEFDYDKKNKKRQKYTTEDMRRDVVKGIIFSEIIREPKCLRDKNESI